MSGADSFFASNLQDARPASTLKEGVALGVQEMKYQEICPKGQGFESIQQACNEHPEVGSSIKHAKVSTATAASHVLIFEDSMQQKILMLARLLTQHSKQAGTKATCNSTRMHEQAATGMGQTGAKPLARTLAALSHATVPSRNQQ